MNHNGKRLRDVDYPRITFLTPDRTFDRLLKETSLHDLKQTVIRKLDLPSDSVISLAQIRDDRTVDLEDEDDFEAFYTVAYSQRVVNVEVRLERLRPSPVSDEGAGPGKKHKEKHDLPGPVDSGRVKVGAREGKKRRVSFAESSSEGLRLRAVSEEPRQKKRKDDSGSVMAVAVAEPGSSHDSIMKKGKKKPEADASTVGPVPDDDDDRSRHNGTMGVRPTTHDVSLEDDQCGDSTPLSTHLKEKKKRTSILSNQSESARAKVVAPVVESSSQTLTPSKPGMNNDSSGDRYLDGVAIQEDNHDADNTDTSSSGGKTEKHIVSSPETENGSGSATSEPETRNTEERQKPTDVTAEPIIDAEIKEIVSKILLAKRKEIQAEGTAITFSEDATTLKSVTEDGAAGDKKKTPKHTKANSKSDAPVCLVCSKAPKHELMNCPLVQEGPSAIQKRIKALRSRKIPDLPLIQELIKIKNDIREKAKRSAEKAKVNAQSRSHPTASRPPDAGDNDVSSNRTKKVAGASPQQRPVNQLAPGDRDPSRTSSDASSLDAGVQQRREEKLDGDKSFISPSVGDLSTLASLDLDPVVRGPESTLLLVNDLPSSEDENDDADRMSGEPEEDEVEKSYPRSKSSRSDSSEREGSDVDDGGEVPMNRIANVHAENHDTAAVISPDPSAIINNNSKERSIPQPSEKGVTSIDVRDAAKGGVPPVRSRTLGDDQPVSDNLNNSGVITGAAGPVRGLVTPVENLASSITQAFAENNSTRSIRRSSRRTRGTEVEEANKSTNSSPALRHNERMKHSAGVEAISAEQATGKRKRAATKTPREGKGISLSQAFDAVHDSVTKSITRAPSPPAREHELRTPRVKSTGKTTRASNGKGKDNSAKLHDKTMQKNAANAIVMDLRTGRSKGQEARKASPPITNWTTLQDDSSIIDGLVPSSPLAATSNASKKGTRKGAKKAVKKTVEKVPTPSSDNDLLVDLPSRSDSEEEAEVNSSLTTNGQPSHGYRRISDISGQAFAKRPNSNPTRPRTSKANEAADLYGRQGKRGDDVEDESDSDSNSDFEIEKKSHIPKERIAGG
ncbi:hypothetical protein APHAL10511_004826 [Amanita phalloides]|nr:hypothetical protein APHAL10511_004826 [Amanita phalloides]